MMVVHPISVMINNNKKTKDKALYIFPDPPSLYYKGSSRKRE
jgi:hypothetical protein